MKLKICGLMTLQDVQAVNKCDVDYAGFVFAAHRQQIDIETAKTLKNAMNPAVKTVGVFVNEPLDYIQAVADSGVIDVVQFHGECEYPLKIPAVKAFRIQSQADIKQTECDYVLFDAYSKADAGATGESFDWEIVRNYSGKPFFLAGGINITNIHDAMKFNPYCIDVSSGVEINGIKCYNKIKELSLCIKRYCQK
jgi:phosphoribosylanthranilate isomerase